MTATIDATGLQVQNFETVLTDLIESLRVALELTSTQADRLRSNVRSALGNLSRIEAEREVALQEALLAVYDTLSWSTEGAALERVVRLLGVERRAAFSSQITATAGGTEGTVIPTGTRWQYNPDETVWLVSDGPYVIDSSLEVEITLESQTEDAITVALDPDTGFDDWTLLDSVAGLSTLEATAQDIVGSVVETDASLRARAAAEAYRRGQGPLLAIQAAVTAVTGVTYVKAWENTGPFGSIDADGIPGRAINVVVEGGDTDEIVDAILASRPAGIQLYGTDVSSVVSLGSGRYITVAFDRVADVDMWIDCTITTSTSEEDAPAGVTSVVAALLLEQAPLLFGIGDDVLPYRLISALSAVPGIDEIAITLSTDDGVLDAYSTAKRSISIRERSVYSAARISVTEA